MPSEQVCSQSYLKGFLHIAGNLTLQSITNEENITPFTASFAPRKIAPTLIQNTIDETNQNSILYNAYRYQLVPGGTLFSIPTHNGLVPQSIGGTSELELIITFSTSQAVPVSEPKVIILVVPIFSSSSEASHAAYVRQFIDHDKYPAASLHTVFFENKTDITQGSISYNTSVQITDNDKRPTNCMVMKVFYFPKGIRMTSQDFYLFKNILTQSNKIAVPKYTLPSSITSGMPVATGYNGQTITTISTSFEVPVTQLTLAELGNKLEYFKKPMSLSGERGFNDTCPYYKTTQYKCVPFHRISDLSGNYVIKNANTLDDILKEQDAVSGVNVESSMSIKNLFIYLAIIVGVVIVLAGLGAVVRWLSSRKPPNASVPATATAAAAATP